MLKRFILALLALLAVSIAAPAAATTCNSVTVPTNIASQPGWTCGTTAPQFDTTNSAPNDWLDPAIVPNTQTGLANIPAPSYGPDRITSLPTCEYRNCSSGVVGATCTSFGLVKGLGGDSTCQETKFRTHVDFSHYGPDDPIRNFGAPGSSHLHCFFGNGATNANSTYGSLRRRALTSTAMGTDINGTAYWYPCIYVSNYDGAGHTAIVKADYIVVYYAGDGATLTAAQNAEKSTLLVPGLSYVFGFNMDDGGIPSTSIDHGMGAWLQNGSTGILDVANAANSAAGYSGSRYSVMNPGDTKHPNAVDYICMGATADSSVVGSGASAARFLALPAGGDPFNGTCESATFSGSVNSSNQLVVSSLTGVIQNGQGIAYLGGDWQNVKVGSQISGTTGGAGTYTLVCNGFPGNVCPPQTLPANTVATHAFFVAIAGPQCWDGKRLWSPGGYKNLVPLVFDAKYGTYVCPNNYYHVPSLRLEIQLTQYGWTDRQRWNLTSDAGARTRLGCNTTTCPPGFSFHTDWLNGWDMVKGSEWMRHCLGAEHNIPHQCAVSQINGTEALGGYATVSCAPGTSGAGGRCPQVDVSALPRINASDPGWGKVPAAWTNSLTNIHHHPAQ